MTAQKLIEILNIGAPDAEISIRKYDEEGREDGSVIVHNVEICAGHTINHPQGAIVIEPRIVLS